MDRLRAELSLYSTITKAQILFEREGQGEHVGRAVSRRIEHIYAKVTLDFRPLEFC